MNERVCQAVIAAVVAAGLLFGCGGKSETTSTDTAVTETVAPEAVTETAASDAEAPEEKAPADTGTAGESGEN